MFQYIWTFLLLFLKTGIIHHEHAPRWLFKHRDGKIDVQHYSTESFAKFPNVPPFDCLNRLDFFAFFFDASVDLTNEMEHGSITAVCVEFKVVYFVLFRFFANWTI